MEKTPMSGIVNKVNELSGFLSFVSLLGAILFYFFSIQVGMEGLVKDHEVITQITKETWSTSNELEYQLRQRSEEHMHFAEQARDTNEILRDVKFILAKLEVTLNSVDRKFNERR